MALSVIRTQVVIENDSALPEDNVVNTYHWMTDVDDLGAGGSIDMWSPIELNRVSSLMTRIAGFYNVIDQDFSSAVKNTCFIKTYNLRHLKPRQPLANHNFTITPGATTAYPNEVALCLSFEGLAISGKSQRRRRGRVYLGPLQATISSGLSQDLRVDPARRTAWLNAARTMAIPEVNGYELAVYSPTNAAAAPDDLAAATTRVSKIWCDNAFDTVRSRGLRPTTRETVVIP